MVGDEAAVSLCPAKLSTRDRRQQGPCVVGSGCRIRHPRLDWELLADHELKVNPHSE